MIEQLVPRDATVLAFNQTGEAYTSRNVMVSFQSAPGAVLTDAIYTPLLPDYQPLRRLSFRFEEQVLRKIRVRQTARAEPDQWSVAELRVYHRGRELPRSSLWRLRARPNPWDVTLAFDNSGVTRWKSRETIRPGMTMEVDFGREQALDLVALDTSRDYGKARLALDGQDASGRWRTLAAEPVEHETAPPLGMRREALEFVKSRGIGYLLVHENDWWAADLAARETQWGVTRLGETFGFRLYRID
jgi:hypothetical protein